MSFSCGGDFVKKTSGGSLMGRGLRFPRGMMTTW